MASNQNQPDGKIVAVYNEKGGSGKSTTTCHLAGTLGYRGYDVLVADLDPQQTSSRWVAQNPTASFPATIWPGHTYGAKAALELEKLVSKYDIIIVDCPPSVEQPATWPVLLVCDLAIIPTMLNPQDIDALPAAKNFAKLAMDKSGRVFPVRVLPVATHMWMSDDQIVVGTLAKDKAFPSFPISLGARKAFNRAMLIGGTAHSLKGSNSSIEEIEALADATLKLLKLPLQPKSKGAEK